MPYITEAFSGTEAVGTTEHSLTTDTAGPDTETSDGEFQAFLDVSDMVAGDELRIRAYEKARSGDAQRLCYEATLAGAQALPLFATPKFMFMHGWDMTVQAIAGGSPTTPITVTWSIRKLSTDDIETDTQDIQGRLPAALVSGRMDSNMQAAANDVITAAVIATGAIDADAIADNAIDAGAIAANAITAAKIADGAIDAATFAADVDAEILSYLVDDATRIDASALNTATGTTIPAILEDTGTTLQAEVDGIQADTEDIQSRLPAALVGGRIDASVGAMAAGVVTAAAVATGAIDADAVAADAVAEIQSGLAAQSTLVAIGLDVTSILGHVDTEVAAIKAKTDSLTFTQAGHVDANVQRINDVTIVGDGSGTPFNV